MIAGLRTTAPKYLSDIVCLYKPARALCSANNNLLMVMRTHVKAGDYIDILFNLFIYLLYTYIYSASIICVLIFIYFFIVYICY